jgi:hypothetical protein
MATVSEIKLIRTDTTLDLSQKAEKVCLRPVKMFYNIKFSDSIVVMVSLRCDTLFLAETLKSALGMVQLA